MQPERGPANEMVPNAASIASTTEGRAGGEDLHQSGGVLEAGVRALAVEQSEEWLTGRRYLTMEELREHRRLEEREAEETMLMER